MSTYIKEDEKPYFRALMNIGNQPIPPATSQVNSNVIHELQRRNIPPEIVREVIIENNIRFNQLRGRDNKMKIVDLCKQYIKKNNNISSSEMSRPITPELPIYEDVPLNTLTTSTRTSSNSLTVCPSIT